MMDVAPWSYEWDGLDGMDCVGSLVGLRYRASEMEVASPEAISGMGSSALYYI